MRLQTGFHKRCIPECRKRYSEGTCNHRLGWDTPEYYSKWFGRGKFAADNSIVRDLKGPTLEFAGVYTEHSEKLLKFFKEFMLEDTTFTERLKAHYRLFKNFTHT